MHLEYLSTLGLCVVQQSPLLLNFAGEEDEIAVTEEPAQKYHPQSQTRREHRDSAGGRELKISKTLVQILRHTALEFDIDVRPDGFCLLQEVLGCKWLASLNATQADVERIVAGNDKKRFELKEDEGRFFVRAVQGHSMKAVDDDQLLEHVTLKNLPDCCVHGTYRKHFESIKAKGLLVGGRQGQSFRNHVHFSSFKPGDKRVISGMRYDCDIGIWIDLKKAIEDGVPFYMSANQVILSPGIDGVVDKKYFTQARDLRNKKDLSLAG